MLCGYLAIFMSSGVSSAADCGSWVAAVRALLVCRGIRMMWCLWSFLLEIGSLRNIFGDGGCDRMSLAGESCTFGTSLLEMS